VRALARRARTTQTDDIRAITSLLRGWSRHEPAPDQAGAATPVSVPATTTSDLCSLDGLEIDRRFVAILIAHAEAALARARMEMIEGFNGSSRRLAEDTSRASWRDLGALRLFEPAPHHDRAPDSPARTV
jgi:uncharacterized protein (DUF305 family)